MVGQACEAAVCVAWFLLSSPPDRHSTQHAARSTQHARIAESSEGHPCRRSSYPCHRRKVLTVDGRFGPITSSYFYFQLYDYSNGQGGSHTGWCAPRP